MKARICLTYDDAIPVHRELVAPALSERGLRGTFFIPAARDDLHEHLDAWRAVARAGHELGNHTCWHPCRMRPGWDWLAPCYQLEQYDRQRFLDELQMANRVLHLVDGRNERSFAAPCGDTTCGPEPGSSLVNDLQMLFPVMRRGLSPRPHTGPMPFAVSAFHADGKKADDVIALTSCMRDQPGSWLILLMHGVGSGTHNNFIEQTEHLRLLDWIATQRKWLETATMLEAARTYPPKG